MLADGQSGTQPVTVLRLSLLVSITNKWSSLIEHEMRPEAAQSTRAKLHTTEMSPSIPRDF